jgi:hypothetical protein
MTVVDTEMIRWDLPERRLEQAASEIGKIASTISSDDAPLLPRVTLWQWILQARVLSSYQQLKSRQQCRYLILFWAIRLTKPNLKLNLWQKNALKSRRWDLCHRFVSQTKPQKQLGLRHHQPNHCRGSSSLKSPVPIRSLSPLRSRTMEILCIYFCPECTRRSVSMSQSRQSLGRKATTAVEEELEEEPPDMLHRIILVVADPEMLLADSPLRA